MKAGITIAHKRYEVSLDKPIFIGIPVNRESNPNCYYTEPLEISPIRAEGFIGSIKEGGAVNHQRLSIAPHGNGTHTECSGHIFDNDLSIAEVITNSHYTARVITIKPKQVEEDLFIAEEDLSGLSEEPWIEALVIRTLPNEESKCWRNYSGTNPPFINELAMERIVALNIKHLVVDLPSVDPEVDGGRLSAHKSFWRGPDREKHCTITELAYIPDDVSDGLYLLNLQTLRIDLDASPSNPVLYSLKPI